LKLKNHQEPKFLLSSFSFAKNEFDFLEHSFKKCALLI
jgi:hypothetical protein